MSDEMTRAKEIDEAVKAADAKRRADAEEAANQGETLNKILSGLDSLGKRMDAVEEERKASKDGEDEEKEEKGDPKKLAADAVRSDSADEDREEIESLAKERGDQVPLAADSTKYRRYADSILAAVQSHIGRGYDCWGKSCRAPWDLERPSAYRRRILAEIKSHSPSWRDVDLHELKGRALRNAQVQIIADSIAASSAPESYGESLREVVRHDPVSGQRRIEFYGSPSAWTNQFKSGPMRVTSFRTGGGWRQD